MLRRETNLGAHQRAEFSGSGSVRGKCLEPDPVVARFSRTRTHDGPPVKLEVVPTGFDGPTPFKSVSPRALKCEACIGLIQALTGAGGCKYRVVLVSTMPGEGEPGLARPKLDEIYSKPEPHVEFTFFGDPIEAAPSTVAEQNTTIDFSSG